MDTSIKDNNRELACFHELLKIEKKDKRLLLSDGKSYVIGRERPDFSLWIWTRGEMNEKEVEKIVEVLRENIDNKNDNYIIAKKSFFELWDNHYHDVNKQLDISFFRCEKLNNIKISDGSFERPSYGDNVAIASCWCKNVEHSHLQEIITLNEALIEIEREIENEQLFVWKSSLGKVLSVARFEVIGKFGKISQVYTPIEYRKRGFASSLVYKLTEFLLEKDLIPVLFTDSNYEPSKHLYQNMGYKKELDLVRFEWVR